MKKIRFVFIYIGLILISSVAIISCSDDIVTPYVDRSDFRYPSIDGSFWSYTITTTVSDIRPDSIRHYFNYYPLVIHGTATILYDTVINSVVTKCFLDEYSNSGFSYANRYYYINNDTALILYARRQQNSSSGILPLRKIKSDLADPENDYSNKIYGNELEILDTLYSTLKYPMATGTEWFYTVNGITTSKKYLGFENVTGPIGTISCMKENAIYSYSPSTLYYNYYSKLGLIKAYWFVNDNLLTTITNPDGAGTYDITQETSIVGFGIPSD